MGSGLEGSHPRHRAMQMGAEPVAEESQAITSMALDKRESTSKVVSSEHDHVGLPIRTAQHEERRG